MEYVKLSNDISLSRIIQGMMRIMPSEFSVDELVSFMEQCIAIGVTTFDTAEIYGQYENEAFIGEALKRKPSLRKQIQLVTKTGINMKSPNRTYKFGHYDTTYEKIVSSCRKSVENLHCGYIDLFLIHREDPLLDPYEVTRALEDLTKEGLIKGYGVSNFDPFKFEAVQHASKGKVLTNQIEVSPACFEHFKSGMIDTLLKYQVAPMIWSPLAGGRIHKSEEEPYKAIRTKAQEIANNHGETLDTILYAWLLYHPMRALPISGSTKIARLKQAVRALDVRLTQEEWFEIYLASKENVLR